MKNLAVIIFILIFKQALSQNIDKPFIKLVEPVKEKNSVKTSRNFLIGSTCKTSNLTVNGITVKVFATGAFAYELKTHYLASRYLHSSPQFPLQRL